MDSMLYARSIFTVKAQLPLQLLTLKFPTYTQETKTEKKAKRLFDLDILGFDVCRFPFCWLESENCSSDGRPMPFGTTAPKQMSTERSVLRESSTELAKATSQTVQRSSEHSWGLRHDQALHARRLQLQLCPMDQEGNPQN